MRPEFYLLASHFIFFSSQSNYQNFFKLKSSLNHSSVHYSNIQFIAIHILLFKNQEYSFVLCKHRKFKLFRYPLHPRVTAVARKRSRSFCQKCRWQVTAKHTYTLRMWLCMMWHGASLYGVHRTCAETAAVSCGTSHASAVSTPLRWILKIRAIKS